MKKTVIACLLLFLTITGMSFITLSSAQEPQLVLQNEQVQPGETLLGSISGSFEKKISLNDIGFYERRRKVFVDYDLVFYNNTYFLYAYMNRVGNFTLKISEILYRDGILKSKTIEKELEVKPAPEIIEVEVVDEFGNTTLEEKEITRILSIKPGAVYTSSDVEISLTNKGNSAINISDGTANLELDVQETQKLLLSKLDLQPGLAYLDISVVDGKTFSIPIIYISLTGEQPQLLEQVSELKIHPSEIIIDTKADQQVVQELEFFNTGDLDISDIIISTNLSILEISDFSEIASNTSEKIILTFFSSEQGFFIGAILIEFQEQNKTNKTVLTIPIQFYVFPQGTEQEDIEVKEESCSDLGGSICENQVCSGEYVFTYSGEYCCIGSCEDKKEGEGFNYRALIGILILLGIGVGAYFAWKSMKKTTPDKPEDLLSKKSKLYEKRVSGGLART